MKEDYREFNEFLDKIPVELLQKKNEEELDKIAKDFEDFKTALAKSQCSLCGYSLGHFSEKKPCFHWLLNQAKGFKPKRHFHLLYKIKSYHQINPYLRWAANSEVPLKNINDLADERSEKKIIEETIRYKNLEWSFSCSDSCLRGDSHKVEDQAISHYHFQMKIDGNVVISYGQFHIPFSEYDHFCFAVARGEINRIKGGHIEGAGMQTLFENLSPEELLESMVVANGNEETAPLRTQTLITADEGHTIPMSDIIDLMDEQERTGEPMAKLIRRLKNISATSYITPGPGVPEIAARTPRKRGKKGASQSEE